MKQKGYRMVKDYKRFRSEVEKGLHKVTITISDEAPDWFWEPRKMVKKNGGYKLPRSYILEALINSWMKLDINVKDIGIEEGFEERIIRGCQKPAIA